MVVTTHDHHKQWEEVLVRHERSWYVPVTRMSATVDSGTDTIGDVLLPTKRPMRPDVATRQRSRRGRRAVC